MRIRLLGENLVAFRDSSGRVGLLDHQCPHRLASLFYGRNEQNGLRCLYHGWQFDVAGRCIDIPSEPAGCPLLNKVKARAYPCREANGIIWTYMGGGTPPPLPAIGWANASPACKTTLKYMRQCNWVQAMEGDFDSAHLGFLHRVFDDETVENPPGAGPPGDALRPLLAEDRQPNLEVEDTEIGVMYGAGRMAPQGGAYWRVTQFQMPFYTSVPAYNGLNRLKIWVPMDDAHTMVWEANWTAETALSDEQIKGWHGRVAPGGLLPADDGWYGRGRFAANAGNDYLLDRAAQKTTNFSGMGQETPIQDAAMQESMGAIVDRTREHLAASDAAIIRMRRYLLAAAEALERQGVLPPGVAEPALYHSHGAQFLLHEATGWRQYYQRLMDQYYEGMQHHQAHGQ